jgi:HSP20 family molecular chaperone IbpA
MLSSLTNSLTLAHTPRIIRSSKSYNAFFDLPGFKPHDLNVSVEEHQIRIIGKTQCEQGDTFCTERQVESHFVLPIDADMEAKMQAILENGVLRVIVPIQGAERPSLGRKRWAHDIRKTSHSSHDVSFPTFL